MKHRVLLTVLALFMAASGCARLPGKTGTGAAPPATVMRPSPAVRPAPTPPAAPAPTGGSVTSGPPVSALASNAAPALRLGRVYRMRPGDPIIITLRGIPGYPGGQQSIEGILDENGTINLPFLNFIDAAGKTASELEREILTRYVSEGYYRTLGVNIIIPTQSYFVRGEVRGPGRFPLTGGVTILQALAAAGGYTEFANKKRVEVLRGDQRILINMREIERYPARDRDLEAGDVIIVPRSAF